MEENIKKTRDEIVVIIKESNYLKAAERLNEYINEHNTDAWGYRRLASLELKGYKNYPNVATIAEKGLEKCPHDFKLKQYLAKALSYLAGEEKRTEELFKDLLKCSEDREQQAKVAMSYADYLVRRFRHKEAIRIYKLLITKNPDDYMARFDLARAYRISGDNNLCLETLEASPQHQDPYWHREVADCLIGLDKTTEALGHIKTARELADVWRKFSIENIRKGFLTRLEYLHFSAKALNGEWEEAINFVLKQKNKESYPTILSSALKYISRNDNHRLAIKFLLRKLKEYPDSLLISQTVDRLLAGADLTPEEVIKVAQDMLAISDSNLNSLIIKAKTITNKSPEDAIRVIDKALEIAESSQKRYGFGTAIAQLATLKATILRQLDHWGEAISTIDEVKVKFNITSWKLEFEKATALICLGSYPEAYEILSYINKTRKSNPAVLDQLAICLRFMGRFNEALKIYKKKTEQFEGDIQGQYGLAKTLFDLNRNDEAKDVLNKIISEKESDVEAKILLAQILKQEERYNDAQKILSGIDAFAVLNEDNANIKIQRKLIELGKQKERQQVELEEAQRLGYLGTMATAVAHEINQPVGVIRAATSSALEDIREGLFSYEEVKPLLDNIWAQTDRLHSIIDNFRRFARGDRGHREKVEINGVAQHVYNMFEEQFKTRGISLKLHLWKKTSKPSTAWANFYQVEEVLINLITNARDAIEKNDNPVVWIKVWKRRDNGTSFAIEDNGTGLSEDYLKNLFMPFYSTKSTEEGTGLGLYISRRIIDSLGGQLQYRQRGEGGACFVVNFPPIRG